MGQDPGWTGPQAGPFGLNYSTETLTRPNSVPVGEGVKPETLSRWAV
jgi:hypothetical protein